MIREKLIIDSNKPVINQIQLYLDMNQELVSKLPIVPVYTNLNANNFQNELDIKDNIFTLKHKGVTYIFYITPLTLDVRIDTLAGKIKSVEDFENHSIKVLKEKINEYENQIKELKTKQQDIYIAIDILKK